MELLYFLGGLVLTLLGLSSIDRTTGKPIDGA